MINKLFSDYKEITLRIIDGINKDIDVMEYFDERNKILLAIKCENINGRFLEEKYIEQGLDTLDKELGNTLASQESDIRKKIKETKLRRNAYNSYATANRNYNLFSTKV